MVSKAASFQERFPPGTASHQDITVVAEERRKCNVALILNIPVEARHFHSNSFGRAICTATPEFLGWDAYFSNRDKQLRERH